MQRLRQLQDKESRIVVGLMSGTSLDGVDAVLARLTGSGEEIAFEILGFDHAPWPDALRQVILANSTLVHSTVFDISQLNVRLAHAYAESVERVAAAAGYAVSDLDLVGAHGQTLHHVPYPTDCGGRKIMSTLQVGDPSVLANLLRVPVAGDFRMADMALGGQGAPLVPYFDYVCFRCERETRGLLNLGGIANITILPAGAGRSDVFAFDTGPGNMVIDALATMLFDEPYDDEGRRAAKGRTDDAVLAALLEDAYFLQKPPKSTGREYFGAAFAEQLAERCRDAMDRPDSNDMLAAGTMLTVLSVYQAYARFVRKTHALDALIVSGGGARNRYLMDRLAHVFAPIPVRPIDTYGIPSEAKEALCFAVLAHEAVNEAKTNLPSVTGASRSTTLGKLCIPA